jgi:hypothetical protein
MVRSLIVLPAEIYWFYPEQAAMDEIERMDLNSVKKEWD